MAAGVRRIAQLGVGAVTLYLAHDAASDAALYAVCKREAEARVAACERAQEVLGPPVRFGPWWDASVTSQGGGKLVTAQFVLRGERCSADARVRMVRPAAAETHWTAPSALLYCSPLGPAVAWRLITADVTLPSMAGSSSSVCERVDMMAQPPPPLLPTIAV